MREHADKMVDLNLAKLGYQYLCVDGACALCSAETQTG